MERENMYLGQKVRVHPIGVYPISKKPRKAILYVRELHSEDVAGLSYSKDSDPKRSMGIYYTCIVPANWFNVIDYRISKLRKKWSSFLIHNLVLVMIMLSGCETAIEQIDKCAKPAVVFSKHKAYRAMNNEMTIIDANGTYIQLNNDGISQLIDTYKVGDTIYEFSPLQIEETEY